MVTEESIQKFSKQCANIFEQVGRDVIGQKDVVEGLVPHARGHDKDPEILHHFGLSTEIPETERTKYVLEFPLAFRNVSVPYIKIVCHFFFSHVARR